MPTRLVMLAAPLLGFGVFALIRWADWGAEPVGSADRQEAIWELLVGASVVLWVCLAGVGARRLEELDRPPAASRREVVGFVALVYAAVALLLIAAALADLGNEVVITGQQWKNGLLHAIAAVAILPWLLAVKLAQLAADHGTWSATADAIGRIRQLRRLLQTATAALGAIVALAVIATGALRDAVDAAGRMPSPDTFVLVYGAWLTAILAGMYLYVFAALERRSRWIVEQVAPLPDPDLRAAEAFATSVGLRAQLAQELDLGGDARRNLEGLVAVLSPLAGALFSRFGGL